MVKVISAYNFQQQDTYSTSGDIIAACLTASDRVAIAHRNHLIEILTLERRCCDSSVSPLSSSSSSSTSQASFDKNENRPPLRSAIPTVDQILRLYYCAKGNFLITLEQKSEATDGSNNFVRVYTNFDIVDSDNCFNIPIRARIASKVTPKSSSTECIEVIELPICGGTPNLVACCQNSGTIAICCGSKLIFYEFRQCTNEAQKFAFIDFFEFPFHIRLDFAPLEIRIAEHVVACVDQSTLVVFKVVDLNEEDTEDGSTSNNSLATDSSVNVCNERANASLDFEVAKRCNHVNGIEFQANILSNWDNDNDKRTSFSEERPLVVNDAKIMLRYTENNQVVRANDRLFYSVRSLLQLRLVQKRNARQIHDEFRTITLKPIYYKSNERDVVDRCPYSHLMKSDDHGNCVGYSFFISTVSDGYLYQFTNQGKWYTENMKCLATYPFTAPVIDVVIDNFVIHAVTESGIETFSSRIGHKLFSSYFEYPMMSDPYPHETSPLVDVPICVMGICGFFGVRYVIASEEKLVLLSTDKERSTMMKNQKKTQDKFEPDWTIYDLLLPRPEILVSDIKCLANIYRNTSPDIYYELLEEAHIIIRLARELKFKKYDSLKNNLEKTFSDTCQLLAEFTIQSDRKDIYSQAVAYYSMCKQPIWNIYVQYWSNRCSTTNTSYAGLVYTLKILLSNIGSSKSDAEQLTHPIQPIVNKKNKGHITEHLIAEEFVDLFKEHAPTEIASICLASSAIREILNDQLIEWFNRKDLNNEEKLCLILCLCRGNQLEKAINILENISRKDIYQTIKDNWIILFDNFQPDNYRRSSFSDLTENVLFVTDRIPIIEAISDVFIYLLSVAHLIDLDFILKLFMNYFAVYLGHKGYRTSQKILEIILQAYFYDLYNSRHRNNPGGKISDTSMPNSEIMLTQSQSSLGHDICNETIRGLSSSGGGTSITFPNIINQAPSSALLLQNAAGLKSTIEDSPTSSSTTVDSNYEDPEFEALKILFRMYLGLLNQYSGEFELPKAMNRNDSIDCDCNNLPDVMGYRLAFLDYMYRCSKTIKAVHSKLDRKVSMYRFEYVNTLPLYNDCDLNDLNMEENIFRRPIVFFEKREKYLNSMPPFDENSFKLDTDDVLYFNDWDKEVNVVLIKIQALLNSGKLDSSIIDDFITFIHSNPNVIGIDSLMTILLPKPEGVEFLIHVNPTCLLPYAKSRLTTGNQWQILFNRILKKKRELPDNNIYSIRLYDKIIEDILKDLVNEKPLEEFLACMPPEYEINHTGDDGNPCKQDATQRKHSPDGIDETNPFQLIIRDAVAKQRSDALCAMIHSTGRQLFDAVYNYQLHLN